MFSGGPCREVVSGKILKDLLDRASACEETALLSGVQIM
jgi:hypothetical protein